VTRRERDKFAADELAVVLSHYDLGVIESITEFRRGSRRSPKVGVVCARGKFLLKKRDARRGGVDRVRYAHAIQNHLESKGFPLPRLMPPRDSEDTVLVLAGAMYELFDYVSGHPYSGAEEETRDAGRVLARFHQAMADFSDDGASCSNGYHDALAVHTGLNALPAKISGHESAVGQEAEILGLTSFLFEAYNDAAGRVETAGYASWPVGMSHSDWHPGNLLFKRGQVLAVIDYDCARCGKPITDVANGALQFSMVAGGDPSRWPDHVDLDRVRQFISGYREMQPLEAEQLRTIPHLMIEALIAEAVLPVAATGSFGPYDGYGFLRMVRRKVAWMQRRLPELEAALGVEGHEARA
jgi:homoserine kinase type II